MDELTPESPAAEGLARVGGALDLLGDVRGGILVLRSLCDDGGAARNAEGGGEGGGRQRDARRGRGRALREGGPRSGGRRGVGGGTGGLAGARGRAERHGGAQGHGRERGRHRYGRVGVPARGDGLVLRGSPGYAIPAGASKRDRIKSEPRGVFGARTELSSYRDGRQYARRSAARAGQTSRARRTLVALSVGVFAVSVASDALESADMTSTVSVKVMTRLADLAGASLTKLPVPTVGPATTVAGQRAVAGSSRGDPRPPQTRMSHVPREAAELHAQKASIEKAGGSLVCLLKGGGMVSSEEVAGFQSQDFWHPDTPLYFDDDLTFFKALGARKAPRRANFSRALFNPWSTMCKAPAARSPTTSARTQTWSARDSSWAAGVVSKDGVQYQHVEKDFGAVAPIDEVVAATKKAAESVQKA